MASPNPIRKLLSELLQVGASSVDQTLDNERPFEIDDYNGNTPWLDPDTNEEWEPPAASK